MYCGIPLYLCPAMLTKEIILQKLRGIKPLLQERYGVTELALFGSYARDEQTPESDIDLLIDYSPKVYKHFLYSTDMLEALFPGIKVQTAIKGGIRPQYFHYIKPDLRYA